MSAGGLPDLVARLRLDTSEMEGGLGRIGGGVGTMAAGVAAGVAVIGAAVAGAAAALYSIGSEFDNSTDTIRVSTGATGAALGDLQQSFRNVVGDVPTDFGSASEAISLLNSRLDLTGAPLESVASAFLNVSRITGTDLTSNLESGTAALANFGVEGEAAPGVLDAIFRASQQSGVAFGDLTSGLAGSGAQLRAVGFDITESTALLATLGKAGVDTGEVMPALSRAMAQAAKDGKDAGQVFGETFDRIKNAPTDTEAAGVALEVFGARAGPKMAALIREGKLSYEEMLAGINGGTDTIQAASDDTADFAEQWQLFKNDAMLALEPIATRVFDALGSGMEAVSAGAQVFFDAFAGRSELGEFEGALGFINDAGIEVREMFDAVVPVIAGVVESFKGGGEGADGLAGRLGDLLAKGQEVFAQLAETVGTVVDGLMQLWDRFGKTLVEYATATFGNLLQIIGGALEVIQGVVNVFVGVLTGDWSRAWDGIKQILSGAWEAIKGVVSQAINLVQTTLKLALDAIFEDWRGTWDNVKGALDSAWDGITSAIGQAVGVVLGVFADLLGGALDMALGVVGAAASIADALGFDGMADDLRGVHGTIDRFKADSVGSLEGLSAGAKRVGEETPTNVGAGINSKRGEATRAAGGMRDDVNGSLQAIGTSAYTTGANASQGLINGMNSKAGQVAAAAQRLAASVGRAMATGLQERSPSRVTRQIGVYAGEGLALGLEDTQAMVEREADALAQMVGGSLSALEVPGVSVGGVTRGGGGGVFESILDEMTRATEEFSAELQDEHRELYAQLGIITDQGDTALLDAQRAYSTAALAQLNVMGDGVVSGFEGVTTQVMTAVDALLDGATAGMNAAVAAAGEAAKAAQAAAESASSAASSASAAASAAAAAAAAAAKPAAGAGPVTPGKSPANHFTLAPTRGNAALLAAINAGVHR